MKKLLTTSNPKTQKGAALGYSTAILHLAPWNVAGVGNVCPHASEGCRFVCLNWSGHAAIFRAGEDTNAIQEARKAKTRWFYSDRNAFLNQLAREIRNHARNSAKYGLEPAVRLNGTSDIDWTRFEGFWREVSDLGVTFYDYTKDSHRAVRESFRHRWNLTYSRKETDSGAFIADALRVGINVAVPFHGFVPDSYQFDGETFRVIDGDAHDLRFRDPRGVIVGLKAKGRAKKDTSGFVLHPYGAVGIAAREG